VEIRIRNDKKLADALRTDPTQSENSSPHGQKHKFCRKRKMRYSGSAPSILAVWRCTGVIARGNPCHGDSDAKPGKNAVGSKSRTKQGCKSSV
jgi:hypothetical protein